MLKKLVILIPLSFLLSCALPMGMPIGSIYTGVTMPGNFSGEHGGLHTYEILGNVEGSSSATSILGLIAVGDGGIAAAYKEAMQRYPEADVLIDVRIDKKTSSFLGLFSSYTTIVTGKAAKIKTLK